MLKVFNKYYTIRNLIFFVGESALIFFGIWCAMSLTEHWFLPEQEMYRFNIWIRILFITIVLQLCLYYNDLYDFTTRSSIFELSMRIVHAIGIACIILAAVYYLFPKFILRQGIFFIGLFFLLFFLVSWRYLYQYLCKHDIFKDRILLVGDGPLARMISQEVKALDSGYAIAGVFSNPTSSGLAQDLGVKHFSDYANLCSYAASANAGSIVMALQERRGRSPIQELLDCKLQGIKVIEGVSFYELLSGKVLASEAPPSWLIFSEGFRRHKVTLVGKRVLDIFFAGLGLILSAPLMGGAALSIWATSKGPVIFRQDRTGQREKVYQVLKFRTMREDAEQVNGAVWAEQNDPRITRVGRVLRKFRLDELPQFWNVLKGEMSFVGPRPERPEFVQQLKEKLPYYSERHTVKPGITGWAQVNYPYGASDEDALRKLEYDLFYIKNLSLLFDLYIILKTVKTVLVGEGAR